MAKNKEKLSKLAIEEIGFWADSANRAAEKEGYHSERAKFLRATMWSSMRKSGVLEKNPIQGNKKRNIAFGSLANKNNG